MNTIYESFKNQVVTHPNALAVMDGNRSLSYRELDKLINTVTERFTCSHPKFVGVIMDHSVEMIASILAILKAGAAYVPAEPSFPKKRINFMLEECRVDFVITSKKYNDILSEKYLKVFIERGLQASKVAATADNSSSEGLAYVLYTSGTTGTPKGVKVTNGNVCHYVRAFQNEFHPCCGERMLQYSVCTFDIFVEEVFTTLLSGATLCIPSEKAKADMHSLMKYVADNEVNIISGFPYLLMEMNKLKTLPQSLRLLISGGDVLRAKYIYNLRRIAPNVLIYNTYGPSETTVCASYFRCDNAQPLSDGTFPIGKAVMGAEMKIIDGEICILGGGVSQGYINAQNPENKNFTTLPDGRRMYRSGDLGYTLPDGNFAFLHRKDHQVMIMGKRVECDEVENVLCLCREVETGVVCHYTDNQGLSYLVAYVVPRKKEFDLEELKSEMSQSLTSFMIPEYFVPMSAMPTTANGKVDRKVLPIIRKEALHTEGRMAV